MQIVTRNVEVKELLNEVIRVYRTSGVSACVEELEPQVLTKKELKEIDARIACSILLSKVMPRTQR